MPSLSALASDDLNLKPADQRNVMEVFVARQPIFDRHQKVYGYELLFRPHAGSSSAGTAGSLASLQVMTNSLLSIGVETLLSGARAFVNFPEQLLADERALSLPPSIAVIEILETVNATPAVIAACRFLRAKGYVLALDDFPQQADYEELAGLVDIIKVDFRATTPAEQEAIVNRYSPKGVHLLAEKVETQEEFRRARKLGYHYFQGYFFARPVVVSRREIPGFKLNYLRILREIHQPELEFRELESLIQRDVSLASKLLRYVNSAIFGWISPVQSIRQALALLGEQEIRNWASLAALPTLAVDKPGELMRMALLRARFCELLAPWEGLAHRKADLFLLGLFSLLDAMLDRPLAEILAEMRLRGAIAETLLGTAGPEQPMALIYNLVRDYESANWEAVSAAASRVHVPIEIIPELYLNAVAWSTEIGRA
ncbi:MAG TPA: HDOD domain-containing protein [Bryobacteraceae bacterium]|nr:HDOD domain-containing protein [Bryobacteraceae bacterium]